MLIPRSGVLYSRNRRVNTGVPRPPAAVARSVPISRNDYAPRLPSGSVRPLPLTLREAFAPRLRSATMVPPPVAQGVVHQRPVPGLSSKAASPVAIPSVNPHRAAPIIRRTTRGHFPDEDDRLTEVRKVALLDELEKDVVALSTAESRASHRVTWTRFHMRWFGVEVPVLPLTPVKIQAVAAQFKAQGYRSFPNYVSTLKDFHLSSFEWSDELARASTRATKSTQRGIGAARQCRVIPITELFALNVGSVPVCDGGPVCPMDWAVLCTFSSYAWCRISLCSCNRLGRRVTWGQIFRDVDSSSF